VTVSEVPELNLAVSGVVMVARPVSSAGVSDTPTAEGVEPRLTAYTTIPVPNRETECGLPLALLRILSVANRWPVAEGVNATCAAHDASGAMVALLQLSELNE
jgi:hypothetical protein